MNIVQKLTWRMLRKNKRRTLITIIGVIISAAMLTAVATISTSFLDLMQRQTAADEGTWHAEYDGVTPDQIESIRNDGNTKEVSLSNELGYAAMDGNDEDIEDANKPYLFVQQYNEEGFDQFPVKLREGRLPDSDDEVVMEEGADADYDIGDELTLDVGDRVSGDDDISGPLDESYSLQRDEKDDVDEQLVDTTEKTFTIVGTMEHPSWIPPQSPSYSVLGYLDTNGLSAGETVDANVTLDKVTNGIYDDTEAFADEHDIDSYQFHDTLLPYYGVTSNMGMQKSLYAISAILVLIIIVGSVSLIYNAFAISVADRSKYLGMLASVGATKKQKRNSVLFEGLVISVISIPIGILAGLLGMAVTFMFINTMIEDALDITEKLHVAVTPMMFAIVVAIALVTVFISAYIPARRASRVSAIDAIRQAQDVKLTGKRVKTSKFVRKLFGMEGEIGLKNLKRNKRRYQATVFSIVISIILFLSVTYFTANLQKTSGMTGDSFNTDLVVVLEDDDEAFIDDVKDMPEVTETNVMRLSGAMDLETKVDKDDVPAKLRDEMVQGEDNKYEYSVNINILADDDLRDYADKVDVDPSALEDENGAILIDTMQFTDQASGKRIETEPLTEEVSDKLTILQEEWNEEEEDYDASEFDQVTIAGLTSELPQGTRAPGEGSLNLIISEDTYHSLGDGDLADMDSNRNLYINSDDPVKTEEDIEDTETVAHVVENHYQDQKSEEQMVLLLSVFTYGFIALITAISVANILNTLSTSIMLRTREFAMLKSIGMTPKGFRKMIHYESIFYGLKALLYGLPLSIGIMYLMYMALSQGFDYRFTLPWISIGIAVVAVFAIVGLTMIYSSAKVRKKNIIDALKQDNM